MTSRYFTDGEGTVLDRDGGSTLPEVVIECGDMALAERIAAAFELQNDIETINAYLATHDGILEIIGVPKYGILAQLTHRFSGTVETVSPLCADAVEPIQRVAAWVRAQQEGQPS